VSEVFLSIDTLSDPSQRGNQISQTDVSEPVSEPSIERNRGEKGLTFIFKGGGQHGLKPKEKYGGGGRWTRLKL
jgi:hypothetical protein